MSLTTFIKIKDVKEKFAKEFSMPKFQLTDKLLAEPQTKHYTHVGTAFDYLMRFYLKQINPNAITKKWIAESSIFLVDDKKILEKIKEILRKSKINYLKYLKTGNLNDEIIKCCLLLAQLDSIYRRGAISSNIGTLNKRDLIDLKNLIKLIKKDDFISKKVCMLNPTFGKASVLVGGADMDLLLDDTLIDIKTTKFLKLSKNNFNQIIGYYILYLIGGIDNVPKNTEVGFIGIYYSRHGLLYKAPIKEIIKNCDLPKFIKWFKKRANQERKKNKNLKLKIRKSFIKMKK